MNACDAVRASALPAAVGSVDATCNAPAIDVRALDWSALLRPRSAGATEPA